MSLIAETKKLRELEQKATPAKWETEENDTGHEIRMGKAITCRGQYPCHQVIEYEHGCFEDDENDPPANAQAAEAEANACLISVLRNLAPAMLEVLGCFKEGDEDLLVEYIYQFTEEYGVDGVVFSDTAFGKFMKRMQKAASIMEQEEREG